jgi:hypothetical protein
VKLLRVILKILRREAAVTSTHGRMAFPRSHGTLRFRPLNCRVHVESSTLTCGRSLPALRPTSLPHAKALGVRGLIPEEKIFPLPRRGRHTTEEKPQEDNLMILTNQDPSWRTPKEVFSSPEESLCVDVPLPILDDERRVGRVVVDADGRDAVPDEDLQRRQPSCVRAAFSVPTLAFLGHLPPLCRPARLTPQCIESSSSLALLREPISSTTQPASPDRSTGPSARPVLEHWVRRVSKWYAGVAWPEHGPQR